MTRIDSADEATLTLPAAGDGVVAALSNDELGARLDDLFRLRSALDGHIVQLLGEAERRESYRDDGATSAAAWAAERFDLSKPGARALVRVAQKAWDVPCLVAALQAGEISFDKLRVLSPVATPTSDAALVEEARRRPVRELAQLVRARRLSPRRDRSAEERRSLRCNDDVRTLTVQLPPESYAEARSRLESMAKEIPAGDGETPWDQRMADAFMGLIRNGGRAGSENATDRSPYFVVVHAPIAALLDESGEASELAGDLERGGFLSVEAVQRVACDATIALAVDDDVGRTMYEGRATHDPTGPQHREVRRRDRHCRFPGCTNVLFTNVHHIQEWTADRGPTDLDNLALLCVHHHGLVHSKQWSMSGNSNEVLTFTGPNGRTMSSRPSPLWTAVTGPAATRAAD
jgi:hypothetical protein